jgi:hypothetical protein
MGGRGTYWIDLNQNRDRRWALVNKVMKLLVQYRWWALVNAVMKFLAQYNVGNFLTS